MAGTGPKVQMPGASDGFESFWSLDNERIASGMAAGLTYIWECPSCALRIKVRQDQEAIVCACGYTYRRGFISHWEERVTTCKACEFWLDFRCQYLDDGNPRTFMRALECGNCPFSKWKPTSKIYDLGYVPMIYKLNLIYHVCPLIANDIWRANVQQMRRRLKKFTGKKVVAVAVGKNLHPPAVVEREFNDDTVEFLKVENDTQLREVATFLPLLKKVESTCHEEATFYAHTKGNSTEDGFLGAEMWRNAMYHHLLDHLEVCRDLLRTHPCVGTHKLCWPVGEDPYPKNASKKSFKRGIWMFAGTFFWFRNDAVFTHPRWMEVPQDRYGAEAWLSGLFKVDEAATVFQPWPVDGFPGPNPYDPKIYLWPIRDT